MSHECIVTSNKEGIFTDTTSNICTNMLHTSIFTDSEVVTCSDLTGISTEPNLVTLTTGDSIIALTTYDKSDITDQYTVTEKVKRLT